jgi:hypothetical protein
LQYYISTSTGQKPEVPRWPQLHPSRRFYPRLKQSDKSVSLAIAALVVVAVDIKRRE